MGVPDEIIVILHLSPEKVLPDIRIENNFPTLSVVLRIRAGGTGARCVFGKEVRLLRCGDPRIHVYNASSRR